MDEYCVVAGMSVEEATELLQFFDCLDRSALKYIATRIPTDYLYDSAINKNLFLKLKRLFRFGDNQTLSNNGRYITYSVSDDMINFIKIGYAEDETSIIELHRIPS